MQVSMATLAKKIPGTVYPPLRDYITHNIVFLIRGPAIATLLTILVEPLFRSFNTIVTRDDWRIGIGASIVHTVIGSLLLLFFLVCDRYGYLQKYRRPRTSRMMPSQRLTSLAAFDYIMNVFAQVPMLYFGYLILCPDFTPGDAPLPHWSWIFTKFSLAILFNEIGLYSFHRWEHHNSWAYINLHKKHHLFIGTNALGTEYTTFTEKLLTVAAMRYFFDAHMLLYFVWIGWRMWEATEIHSGYVFEGTFLSKIGLLCSDGALFHDDHHVVNSGNYGTHWLRFDGMFGTCDAFFRDHAGERSTIPAENKYVTRSDEAANPIQN